MTLTQAYLQSKIESTEIITHVTNNGKILRWAIFNMANGFSVVGKPSCCINPSDDKEEKGTAVAMQNTTAELWALEGYAAHNEQVNTTKK